MRAPRREEKDATRVLVRDASKGLWLDFREPVGIIEAVRLADVVPALQRVEAAIEKHGLHAAGFVAYEAAPAFDSALKTRTGGGFPLLWFGLFPEPREIRAPSGCPQAAVLKDLRWTPSIKAGTYRDAITRIKEWIRAGDTYQVNFTYRLRASIDCDPLDLQARLLAAQDPAYGAYLSTVQWAVCSASPELFFRLDGRTLESRPMKGTAPRGLTLEKDRAQAEALRASEKERAENLMILDMVRNDLGKVAQTGSVEVTELFSVERYPTLWQMTSTARARTTASVAEIFSALFPAASITGAPKPRTMEIIAGLESSPRRIYTGAIGFIAPGRRAQFNVAIRTLLLRRRDGAAEYGVGGGIVWDSEAGAEWSECRTKSLILKGSPEPFELLETLLWTPGEGYALLPRHLERLERSAEYFGYPLPAERLRLELEEAAADYPPLPHRVRILLSPEGRITREAAPHAETGSAAPPRVALAPVPIDRHDRFLYHKTTRREVYESARRSCPDFDDVILVNEEGEATEATVANLFAEIDGVLCTPPVACGLLPGTYRAAMLDRGECRERRLTVHELLSSPRVLLGNSVRGLYQVTVVDPRTGKKAAAPPAAIPPAAMWIEPEAEKVAGREPEDAGAGTAEISHARPFPSSGP